MSLMVIRMSGKLLRRVSDDTCGRNTDRVIVTGLAFAVSGQLLNKSASFQDR